MALDSKKEGKSRESAIDVEQLEKYSQIQSEVHANRLQVLEVQQKLSSEKLEASRLNHLAAIESKEAKMLEAYNSLLLKDTGGYSAEEKDEHLAALICLRKRLFPED
jgi:predicted ATP-dependent serine protease